MFIAKDAGDVYNILPTNFGLVGQKSIYSHFKNVKNGQAKKETWVDDIVLLKQSDVPQNQWSMGRATEVHNDQKGLVRSVTLKIGEHAGNKNTKHKLERPIDKIVLLLGSDNVNDFQ